MNDVVNRNRALEGDVVAIDLNDRSEWKVLNEQIIEQVRSSLIFLKVNFILRLDKAFQDLSC